MFGWYVISSQTILNYSDLNLIVICNKISNRLKTDKRQGITKTLDVSVNDRIGTASWYIATRQNGLTSTETNLLQHAKEDLKLALEKKNTFYNTNFKPYYQDIIKINMTKGIDEIKTFKLD